MQISDAVIEVATGQRPSREGGKLLGLVPDHEIPWYPKTWHDYEGLRWAIGDIALIAEACAGSITVRKRAMIPRRIVFEQFRVGDPVTAFLAAMIWGYGTWSWGRPRVQRIHSRNGDELRPKLEAIIAAARSGDAGLAWDAFMGAHRLLFLGPAFATKVAYFAAFADGPPKGKSPPLIADALVDLALGNPGVTRHKDVYLDYVRAATVAGGKIPSNERSRPDQIELALFAEGRHLRKAARERA